LTLFPGLYKGDSSIHITGDLTLDAQNDDSAVFIFQIGSTLVTAAGAKVVLAGGAKASNIFWQVRLSSDPISCHFLASFDDPLSSWNLTDKEFLSRASGGTTLWIHYHYQLRALTCN
jgi:hypothetical protein